MKKKRSKLALGALAFAIAVPSIVAVAAPNAVATSDVTLEDRTIPYEYKESTANLGIKWASGEDKVTIKAAITTDGRLYTWNTVPTYPKEQVIGKKFISVAYSGNYQGGSWLAISEEGDVYQWGKGGSTNPTKVEGIANVTKVVVSSTSTVQSFFAITADGSVYAWGSGNSKGELGVGTTTTVDVPTRVVGLSNVVDIKSYYTSSSLATMAVTSNGDLYTWGVNSFGRVGVGAVDTNITTPTKIPNISSVKTVKLNNTARVLTTDGKLYVWGYNSDNIAGDGTSTHVLTPKLVLTDVKDFSASTSNSFAVTNAGKVYTWGTNKYGQAGLGHKNNVPTPVVIPSLSDIKSLAAGNFSTYFLTTSGDVWATGENSKGEMGNGTKSTTNVTTPVKSNISNVVNIYAQMYKVQAVTTDKNIYVWGSTVGSGSYNISPTVQWSNNEFFKYDEGEGVYMGVSQDGKLELSGSASSAGNIPNMSPLSGSIDYNYNVSVIKEPASTVVTFKKLADNAVSISWDAVKGVTNYKVTRNGTQLFNSTETSFVDNNAIYDGVDYTYVITFTTDIGTYTKTMVYTHGGEPDFSAPVEPETPTKPITWTFDNPTGDFVTTMIPQISVIGGKAVEGITLNKVDLGSTKTITTVEGDITFTPDGNGNTVVSIPNGLGDATTNTTVDVQYNGVSILSVVIKPKPVLNFNFTF